MHVVFYDVTLNEGVILRYYSIYNYFGEGMCTMPTNSKCLKWYKKLEIEYPTNGFLKDGKRNSEPAFSNVDGNQSI